MDCGLLEKSCLEGEDLHFHNKEWIQLQMSLLLPATQVFSYMSPSSDSPPQSPPRPENSELSISRVRCDSGIDMHLSNEIEEDVSALLQTIMPVAVESQLRQELKAKDDEIASLRVRVAELEKQNYEKNCELKDHDFRLFLAESISYDGLITWKIPQFSRRKDDAETGKCTSLLSCPFYTGKYGYKMCLRLYIMGDGIGKGTHFSLFFVVMHGEFDNILQWPFTHKVTFKLINQAGGRDIVDTFQPDPMSSSFRKPKSDMNVASGFSRFVSHTELEMSGFIVEDTLFIMCMIDTSTICHR